MATVFLLLAGSVVTAVASQLLFKSSVNEIGAFHLSLANLWAFFLHLAQNPKIIVGFVLYGLSFLFWVTLLSRTNLSVIYPIATSLNIIAAIVLSSFLLHESLQLIQLTGIVVVLLGVYLIFI